MSAADREAVNGCAVGGAFVRGAAFCYGSVMLRARVASFFASFLVLILASCGGTQPAPTLGASGNKATIVNVCMVIFISWRLISTARS